MTSIFASAAAVFGSFFRGRRALILENLALRQQLAVYKRAQKRPRLQSTDRAFWVWLSKLWDGWRTPLILVRPETVIRWHRQGFRLYWRRKSRTREIGRPTIPREHIDFIRRMSADNPSWGEDKIFEELDFKFGIKHSTSTLRKYMVKRRSPGDRQTWKTFLKNHGHEIFACDFMTQHTALFSVIYVFVVMELNTRRIVRDRSLTFPPSTVHLAFSCTITTASLGSSDIRGKPRKANTIAATSIFGSIRCWGSRACQRPIRHQTQRPMHHTAPHRYDSR
jgi:hypothetical protein